MTTQEVLQQCTVDGNVVKLPNVQLDRKEYLDVKKALELIGGSWKGGKVSGFVFKENPSELLAQVASGEKRNLKKEFQFFATPDHLADKIVDIAFSGMEPVEPLKILEPSAGQGAIVKAINRYTGGNDVHCYELMPLNQTILNGISTVVFLGEDFMQADPTEEAYDVIVANPPFNKNQDIDHIRKMYEVLSNNGRLVSIASKHWLISNNKKETSFREWLEAVGASVSDVDAGEFKESGTNVATCIICINKAA